MPLHTIETTYHLPVYRQGAYDAASVDEACKLAIDDDDWSCELPDHETAGQTFVTGIWRGRDTAYQGEPFAASGRFVQTVQRKAELFDTLVRLLKEPAQPMGLSRHDFDSRLLRALAAIAVADGIFRDASVVRPREISAIHSS
ncbi:hypothetical protein GA830_19415 (plasmid) [Mesorhizobium sp. NBSH29]|uniref:hypothetical protein n=1 Tax=Mesorhizobium sp. NBSH29 TaxID=2654249 RepID=UPI001896543C|nr:hypothetical protein [Mesorhizobium sp. NBSH29]QPC89007.1 hypothetical protein GA830_19415 [Mesorhizobium sp. NBSH29]